MGHPTILLSGISQRLEISVTIIVPIFPNCTAVTAWFALPVGASTTPGAARRDLDDLECFLIHAHVPSLKLFLSLYLIMFNIVRLFAYFMLR